MNMFKVTNEVRGILLKSKEIVGYVEDKIFPVMAPENTAGDYIIYQRDGYKPVSYTHLISSMILCEFGI